MTSTDPSLDDFDEDSLDDVLKELTAAGLEKQFTVDAAYQREANHVQVTVSVQPVVDSISQFENVSVQNVQPATFRVVLNPRDTYAETVFEMIEQLNVKLDDGVPHGRVIAEGLRCGWERKYIEESIEYLRKCGRIYSPQPDCYRPT